MLTWGSRPTSEVYSGRDVTGQYHVKRALEINDRTQGTLHVAAMLGVTSEYPWCVKIAR